MLNKELEFSRLSVHIQQVEEKKKKIIKSREKDRQAKKARTVDQNYSQPQSGNWGIKWQNNKFWSDT